MQYIPTKQEQDAFAYIMALAEAAVRAREVGAASEKILAELARSANNSMIVTPETTDYCETEESYAIVVKFEELFGW